MDYSTNNPNPLKKLDTIDVEELMATPYAPKNFIVAEMIPEGLTLLCGPSKIGKSWLVLQLCICVALGVRFMGFNTQPCDVLYLALEDTFARVKERVSRITEDCPTRLRFAVQAGALGDTLEEQLVLHKAPYPETKLVVIDTLQKVRGASAAKSNGSAYSKDYTDIGALKKVADDLSIAIVLVHHLRKTQDKDDPFNEISGSTGLMGAADTALLLKKFDRGSDHAELLWTGRDVQDGGVCLTFEDCIWETIDGNVDRSSSCYRKLSPIVYKTCEYIKEHKHFRGTASELLALMGVENVKPNVLTRSLSTEAYDYLQYVGILYDSGRTGSGRWLELTLKQSDDPTICDSPTVCDVPTVGDDPTVHDCCDASDSNAS